MASPSFQVNLACNTLLATESPLHGFDLQKILESKHALRRHLAARPVAEKLRMLDALRERELAIRGSAVHSNSSVLHEKPVPFRPKPSF